MHTRQYASLRGPNRICPAQAKRQPRFTHGSPSQRGHAETWIAIAACVLAAKDRLIQRLNAARFRVLRCLPLLAHRAASATRRVCESATYSRSTPMHAALPQAIRAAKIACASAALEAKGTGAGAMEATGI